METLISPGRSLLPLLVRIWIIKTALQEHTVLELVVWEIKLVAPSSVGFRPNLIG